MVIGRMTSGLPVTCSLLMSISWLPGCAAVISWILDWGSGALKLMLMVIFFLVGFLEVFSILFRPVSLSFRLYGNIFAGENMLEAMANLVPSLKWLIPVPFYFMELLVGLVQALVFMLLTAVFTMLICMHEEGHGHEKAHH